MSNKKAFISLLFSGILGACTNMAPSPDYTGYKPAKGVVSYVYQARIRRQGYHAASYRVMYTPPGHSDMITVDGNLVLKEYQKGDSVDIYYDPKNPENAVTDKIE